MTHGFNIVPIRVQDKRAIVIRVVMRANSGRAVFLSARCERRAVKRVDGWPVLRGKGDVKR